MRLSVGTSIKREDPAWQAIVRQERPAQEHLPVRLFAKYEDQKFSDSMPALFHGEGGVKIRPPLKACFDKLNLGAGFICPAQILSRDMSRVFELEVYTIGNLQREEFLVPELCSRLLGRIRSHRVPNPPDPDVWRPPYDLKDDDIVIRPSKLTTANIWIDSKLSGGLFFDDAARDLFCGNGFEGLFNFKTCKVEPAH